MAHRETQVTQGYRKLGGFTVGSALAGMIGWYLRTKLPGWEDFPTELLGTFVGGVAGWWIPEKRV